KKVVVNGERGIFEEVVGEVRKVDVSEVCGGCVGVGIWGWGRRWEGVWVEVWGWGKGGVFDLYDIGWEDVGGEQCVKVGWELVCLEGLYIRG
uniref:hypothetical protein n=1 Tax=Bacillus subtilis TaxID=1423 RepID=UPI001BDB9B89